MWYSSYSKLAYFDWCWFHRILRVGNLIKSLLACIGQTGCYSRWQIKGDFINCLAMWLDLMLVLDNNPHQPSQIISFRSFSISFATETRMVNSDIKPFKIKFSLNASPYASFTTLTYSTSHPIRIQDFTYVLFSLLFNFYPHKRMSLLESILPDGAHDPLCYCPLSPMQTKCLIAKPTITNSFADISASSQFWQTMYSCHFIEFYSI